MNEMPLLKKYFEYTKERFPIPGIVLYSGSMFFAAYFFAAVIPGVSAPSWTGGILGFLVIFLTILHIRVLDEHKDYDKDIIAYPERMLSRGIITLKDLRLLLYVAVFLQAGISAYLGMDTLLLWAAVFIWTLFMYREFFCPEFLNRHMGLYLISHQLIIPLILLFAMTIRADITLLKGALLSHFILFSLASMGATVSLEIARKTWSKEQEHEHADSYTSVWGNALTVIISQIISLSSLGIFLYLYSLYNVPFQYTVISSLFALFYFIADIMFLKKPQKNISKLVETAGAFFMLGVLINSAVAFYFM